MSTDVLYVEDNPSDARLVQEAFRHVNPGVTVHIAYDGIAAWNFLTRNGTYHSVPRPDIILLDLNIPELDGGEVLAKIKYDDNLKSVPTIVLTSSILDCDAADMYLLHAEDYLQKPGDWYGLVGLVAGINDRWLIEKSSRAEAPWVPPVDPTWTVPPVARREAGTNTVLRSPTSLRRKRQARLTDA